MNGHGYKYNDSPRTIYQTMRKYGIDNNYQIVWALKNPEQYEIPGNAEKIKIDTFAYFVVALRAKYWISCVNIERGLHFKKKKTIYLNTWHGASLNYVGNSVAKRNDYHF
jgi:CDP-glycerol glycerophosphotransferase